MRIDQVGANVNIQTAPVKQSAQAGRTDSPAPVQAVRQPLRQEPTTQGKQDTQVSRETQEVDGGVASGERTAENEQEVIQAITKANKQFKTYDRKLEFSIHEATKQIMVKVINTEDDTIIREIPSEKVLDMVAHMWEIAGLLVDEKR